MNTYELPLKAISDPTRRALLDRLRVSPCSVSQLTEVVLISQPAVSQHLRVLKEAGLVQVQSEGTKRIYHLTPDGLLELREYIESFWDEVLGAFKQAADNSQQPKTKKEKPDERKYQDKGPPDNQNADGKSRG